MEKFWKFCHSDKEEMKNLKLRDFLENSFVNKNQYKEIFL